MKIPAEDLIRTLSSDGRAEIRIKGSRFIALASHAYSREEAGKIIRAQEKKYHAASHHCWGWRALEARDDFGYNDDGEPAGTAGLPILKAIEKANLQGVAVVVTRYFGGVKLGTGPLARAYAGAAGEALGAAGKTDGMLAEEFALTFDYPLTGLVNKLVESGPALITTRIFEERVGLNIAVSRSRAEPFIQTLTESAAGKIEIKPLGIRPVFPD
ncbi:MAG TPA: YigZ family protein [archaeon]|nr:YigZ family protein [archaeon]